MEKDKGIFSFRKHPVGELPDGKKERKRKESRLRGTNARKMHRALGVLLAAAMIFNTLPASGFAVSASEQEKGLCKHHPEHTAQCGYQEAQKCGYVCEICNGTEPEDTENNAENDTENAGTDTAECICETLCTEDSINGDCPVCGAEDADLSRCVGEKTEEQEKTGERVITAWEWIDPEEYLTDGMLALPGAGRENPAFAEDVTALLPEKIQAKVAAVDVAEDGEETEEDAEAVPETEDAEITLTGWKCASYPEDGAYEGTYTFTAFLPEGFGLAEDVAALEVEVELGGGEMLLRGGESVVYQKAAWDESKSEVVCTEETADSCTPVENSAAAVTWYNGWYVVNGNVTISEPITVSGEVNLILVDGCTLTAEKGIVVETGNSLTIYAQSGGTGTLTVTGTTDSDHNASAGIGGSIASVDSGTITIHGGVINATGGGQSGYYGAAGIGGGTSRSGNGGNSGTIIIYGNTVTANSGEGDLTGAGIGGGSGGGGGTSNNITIYGGSVTASSTGTGTGGAGIGGGGGLTGGGAGNNIQIYGGTINATGSNRGAGIGGGGSSGTSGDGTVTISGGIVTAVGGKYAAGIGGGGGYSTQYGGCTGGTGSVTISGGIVDAKGGTGNSSGNYAGDPIGNGGNTTATATVNKTTGIVFENGAGTVCGAVTLDGSYTVPGGYTLNIPVGASLSGSGTLSGGSAFTTENLTADMISVPEDWHYTGEDLTEKIKSAVSLNGEITICGQTFTASTDGWELSVEKVSELEYTVKYTHTDKGTLSKTVTIARGQTALSDVVTYKEDGTTPANTFSVGETIIVKATATFPANNAIMAAAKFDTPTGEQMAVYYNDTQISAPSTVENGVHTMTVDTSNLPESALNKEIALTVKYIESDNASGADTEAKVTVTAAARVEKDGITSYVDKNGLLNAFDIDSGNDGAVITLLEDVELTGISHISIQTDCTLDFGGHTIHADVTTGVYAVSVIAGKTVTIRGAGGISGINNSQALQISGNVTLEGGTFSCAAGSCVSVVSNSASLSVTSPNVRIENTAGRGLRVGLAQSVQLSAGTYSGTTEAITFGTYCSLTLTDLLADGHAYHSGNTPIPLQPDGKELTGTVTVKECNHTGGLTPSENGYQHGGPCKCCGAELPAANHTLGAENKCSGCGAELVAKVNDTCYTDFQSAWSAAQSAGTATVTLLADVNLGDQCITLSAGNVTLTGSGRTLTGSGSQTIEVTGGELIVENVTVKNTNSESHTNSGIHVPSGKTAKVTVGESATVTGSTGIRQQSGSLAVSGTVEGTNSSGFGVIAQGATLIVEEGAKISGGNEGIRHTVGGSLTINGGTINGSIAGVQITEDVTAKLNGGTFTGVYNAVAINGSDTTTMGNLLNTGYAIFKDDGTAVERTKTSTGPGTFTVQECEHDGVTPTSNNNGTHSINCPYCGHTGTAMNCAYVFSGTTGTCAACRDSVTVAVSGTENLIYDGTGKKPGVTVMRADTELTAGTDYTVAYADNIDAGTAKVIVTIGNSQGTYTGNFNIGKATPTIAWSSTSQELTYTGQQAVITAPTVTLENNENFGGTISYSYKKQGETAYKDGLPTDAGTYTIKAHVDAEGSYNAADSTNELTLTISYMDAPKLQYNGSDRKEYYNGDVAVTAVSADSHTYTVSDTLGGDYKASYTISAQQGTVTKTLYFKDAAGHMSDGVEVTVKFDLTPPTGEIAVGAKWWQNVLRFVSFGNYSLKEYTVSIKAKDEGGSGIDNDKIEYAIVTGSSQYTDASELEVAGLRWMPYDNDSRPTVPVNSSPYVVYARLTDNAGNVTYISTDGILLDDTPPTVGNLSVPEDTKKDVTAGVAFTVSEAADYYYVVLLESSDAPSAEDIIVTCGGTLPEGKTGTDITGTVDSGKGAASGDTLPASVSVEAKNLQPYTAYSVYVTAVDRALDITDSAEGKLAGNIADAVNAGFTTKKTLPVITKTPAVAGTYGQSVGEMTVTGGTAQAGSTVLAGTWTVSDADKNKKPSAGTAEVTVIFTPESDNYDSVSVQSSLTVSQRRLDTDGVTVSEAAGTYTYTGSEIKPLVEVNTGMPASGIYISDSGADLTANDFTVSYSNNKEAGTASVTITGRGNYTGSVTRTFTIAKAPGREVPEPGGNMAVDNEAGTYTYTVTPTDGAVYRMGDVGAWTTANEFKGVKPGTSVTFYAKMPETGNYKDGTPKSITVDFPKLTPAAPALSYTRQTETGTGEITITITPAEGAEYSFDGGTTWQSGEGANIQGGFTTSGAVALAIRLKETETHNQSPVQTVTVDLAKEDREAPPAFRLSVEANGETDYTVTIPPTEGCEYSFDGAAWSEINGKTGVSVGEIVTGYKRYKETEDYNAGSAVSAKETMPKFTVKTPVISPAGGSYSDSVSVTVTCGSPDAEIYYTTDGSTPGRSSARYTGTFAVSVPATVKAVAIKDGLNDSDVATVSYAKKSGGGSGGSGSSGNSGGKENNSGQDSVGNDIINPGNGNTFLQTPATKTADEGRGSGTGTAPTKPEDGTAAGPGTAPESGADRSAEGTRQPFIKGEDGKTGWDVIRAEEEKAEEGSVINVDMNGSAVVPGDIFDSIKGKDITITFDMGNGILWSVDGKSITADRTGDIDFSVKTGAGTVPVDIVNNVTGERYSIQISLSYEGEFGFTAVLSIGLGRENAGYSASLYYYNESTGELEFICSDEVAEDGTVSLAFPHASDYVIAIGGEEENSSAGEPAQPGDQDVDSAGPARRIWWLIAVGALVIVMGIGVFFVEKKGKDEDSGQ